MVEFRPKSVKRPELTKLNKEYILPKGMGRSEAIEKRIKETGIQGQLTDWSGRKLNESDEDFIRRCINTVKNITAPRQSYVANVAPKTAYRRKR